LVADVIQMLSTMNEKADTLLARTDPSATPCVSKSPITGDAVKDALNYAIESGVQINDFLNIAAELSQDSRVDMLIKKYKAGFADYEKSLGTDEFKKALGEFMEEKIEGKLIAASRLSK
jgi:hypothetical protein